LFENERKKRFLKPICKEVYLFKYAKSLEAFLLTARTEGQKIGFVPTMGALHSGHLSLITEAQKRYDVVVCSIFVNPTQFNDPADLAKYPRTLERDLELLSSVNTTAVYFPEVNDVYPQNAPQQTFDFGELELLLEGAHRPGHFAGVGMVVARLLEIVKPNGLFLGEKDYQQCLIIERLIQQIGLADKLSLHLCPTSREANGLAMSSRNQRLSTRGKEIASHIFIIMQACVEKQPHYSPSELSDWAMHSLEVLPETRPEYVAFADARTLRPIEAWNESNAVRVLVAVWVEGVRLIDNAQLF
jgi:pantoate--beta-alanine ligase